MGTGSESKNRIDRLTIFEMRKIITTIGLCLLMMNTLVVAQEITSEVEQRAREIVSRMTLQEKIEYISGYTSFSLRAIPRLGIPEIKLADGPQGIRNHAPKSTLYPSGILSASTWNRELLYKLGQGLVRMPRQEELISCLDPE